VNAEDAFEQSELLYERAIFAGDEAALVRASRLLDGVEADPALARGRIMHGEFLLERTRDHAEARENPDELPSFEFAAARYRAIGDRRGEAEASFWIGCCHQVVRRDNAAAVPVLERALSLAAEAGDQVTMAEALRHLGIAEHAAGRLDQARARLEESTALRRQLGNQAGVAANLVGQAYIALGQQRREDAIRYLDEATALASASNAPLIQNQVDEARAQVTGAGC
jgi:tetratricopeptide (TPR) repeat protein